MHEQRHHENTRIGSQWEFPGNSKLHMDIEQRGYLSHSDINQRHEVKLAERLLFHQRGRLRHVHTEDHAEVLHVAWTCSLNLAQVGRSTQSVVPTSFCSCISCIHDDVSCLATVTRRLCLHTWLAGACILFTLKLAKFWVRDELLTRHDLVIIYICTRLKLRPPQSR
ncbi:hypothetical protein BV22DRAFT_841752 [Leucogyrophana mollusca]|uniref:Uncharacterized protein n=1 Tax=Leucogyrophana mollusca TaxID=85980 RepID=A0ACB8B2D4_9AGAM|nr:hypothetical protein BV22DRAFT_841752 [Leucogyrophana mollusca]